MTEIEQTLSRVLAAEADRHEPPVFNAFGIAEAATAKRRFPRRPLFAVIAAVLGTAGAGGAAVFATAGGGQHRPADTVTVTIQSKTGSVSPQTTDASVKAWVRSRAVAEGLKDVTATVRHDPWRLQVTGRASDLALLKTFAEPGILQLRPTAPVPTPSSHQGGLQYCQTSIVKTGTQWLACGRDGERSAWVTDPVGVSYHVVASRSLSFSQGTDQDVWGVIVTFDSAGTNALTRFSTAYARKTTAVLVDGAVAATPVFPAPEIGGQLGFAAGKGQRQADLLGAILTTQGPADLEGATVTVSTR